MAASGRAIVLGALLAGFSVGFRSQTLWITVPLLLAGAGRPHRPRRGRRDARVVDRVRRRRAGLGRAAAGGQRRAAGLPCGARQPGRRGLRRRRDALPESHAAAGGVRLAAHLRLAVGQRAAGRRGARAGGHRRAAARSCASAEPGGRRCDHGAVSGVPSGVPGHDLRALRAAHGVRPVAFLAAVALEAAGAPASSPARRWRRGASRSRCPSWRPTSSAAARPPGSSTGLPTRPRRPRRRRSSPCTRRCSVRSRPSRGRWGAPAGVPASAGVARAGALLAERARSVRCGSWPTRGAPISALDRSSGAARGRALRVGTSPSMSMLGGMRPADVQWYRLARARVVRHRGLEPHARNRGHGPPDGPRAASGADSRLRAPARRGRPPARRRPQSGRRGRSAGHLHAWPSTDALLETLVAGARVFRALGAVPAGASAGAGRVRRPHCRLGLAARCRARWPTAIEQFDLQSPGVTMWAFGRGFHEPELDNQRGRAWRWMSERGVTGDAADRRRRDAGARRRVAARRTSTRPRRSKCGAARPSSATVALVAGTSSSGSAIRRRAPARPRRHAAPHHDADVRAG